MSEADTAKPAAYTKKECPICKGLGRVPKDSPHGFYNSSSDRRRFPMCSNCYGSGFLVTRVKAVRE